MWRTIVRDDGNGMSFFLVIMGAGVGAFAAAFRPAGMARAMIGVSIMQAMLGIAVATAPPTASMPDGMPRALAFCGFFIALWLISAAFFRASAQGDGRPAAAAPAGR